MAGQLCRARRTTGSGQQGRHRLVGWHGWHGWHERHGRGGWNGRHRSDGRATSSRAADDSGFALLEVVVAMVILSLVVVAVGFELTAQVASIGASRNEEAAQGLLSKALGEVSALPYADVAAGLSNSDATVPTDARIVRNGSTWTFSDRAEAGNGTGEAILHSTRSTPVAPFVPHTSSAVVNGVTYTESAYPTQYTTPATSAHKVVAGTYRVTIVVSWSANGHGSPTTLVGQTIVYSAGSQCLSGASNPFAAPCKPNFVASSAAGGGVVKVVPASAAAPPIQGISFTSFELVLPGASSSADLMQTSSVVGSTQASGAILTAADGQVDVSTASTAASSDPASPDGPYEHATLTKGTGPIALVADQSGDAITVTPSSPDIGSSVSTAFAKAAQACDDRSAVAQATTLPCGSGAAAQMGSATVQAHLYAGATDLGTALLAGVTAQPGRYKDKSFASRRKAGTTSCSATRSSGCAFAAAQMALGNVVLAGLPAGIPAPAGWSAANGLVSLTTYSASVSAASASGSTSPHLTPAPSAAVPISGAPTPVIHYWNGTGYTQLSLPIAGPTPAVSLSIPTVTATDPSVAGGSVTVTITASLSARSPSKSTSTSASCVRSCRAGAAVTSPLAGTITYSVTQGATVIADLMLTVNLGSLSATTGYQAAS